MSRILSTAAMRALYGQQTDDGPVVLVTITHATLDTPLRVASGAVSGHEADERGNPVGFTMSRGDKFLEFPFTLTLPEDRDDQTVTARIEVDNIDRVMIQALREADSPPAVKIEIVMGKSPDTVEGGPFLFTLQRAEYDALIVSGTLGYDPFMDEAYPADTMSPATFPGIFF